MGGKLSAAERAKLIATIKAKRKLKPPHAEKTESPILSPMEELKLFGAGFIFGENLFGENPKGHGHNDFVAIDRFIGEKAEGELVEDLREKDAEYFYDVYTRLHGRGFLSTLPRRGFGIELISKDSSCYLLMSSQTTISDAWGRSMPLTVILQLPPSLGKRIAEAIRENPRLSVEIPETLFPNSMEYFVFERSRVEGTHGHVLFKLREIEYKGEEVIKFEISDLSFI